MPASGRPPEELNQRSPALNQASREDPSHLRPRPARTRAQRLSALLLLSCAPQSSITRGFAGIPMCSGMLLLLWNAAEKSCCQSAHTHSLFIHTGVKLRGEILSVCSPFHVCASVQLWFVPLHLHLASALAHKDLQSSTQCASAALPSMQALTHMGDAYLSEAYSSKRIWQSLLSACKLLTLTLALQLLNT